MYLSHFKFTGQPFRKVTRAPGEFLVPYHQDVFGLLREKSRVPGIVGLFSDDDALLSALTGELQAQSTAMVTINAFPKLNASTLIYKLNPKAKETKNRLQAIDATLNQWLDAYPACRKTGMVLCISAVQAMRDGGWEVLGSLLTRAEEMAIPLTLILTGTSDQERRVRDDSGLGACLHTRHTLRSLTCREFGDYVQGQMTHHGAEKSPFSPARVRKMHALTKGSVSKLNALAHLALLASWTERAPQVGPRHLRLAAGEVLPRQRHLARRAMVGLFASVMFAACGWYFSAAINAKLPVQLPVPARWTLHTPTPVVETQPNIDNEVVNQPDAMHQLYTVWGYDASTEQDKCESAGKVNLACKQGHAALNDLEKEGYPWISELNSGNHMNYAVVVRSGKDSLDLLMNNRTWQVSRNWFTQHATGNYTLLHRLTPEGKESISATSDPQEMQWLDSQLSEALHEPETHAKSWTATLAARTRTFQSQAALDVDGLPGEETLMALMRMNNSTPAILTPVSTASVQGKR
jgi:general secretion pathway protein A